MYTQVSITIATVLSRASAHGPPSLSAKIWGWAVTRRTHLNGSTIPTQGPTSNVKLAAMGLNGLASSVHPYSSRPARQWIKLYRATKLTIVSKFVQRSVITRSTRISCCRGRTRQTRPQTGVCEPLMSCCPNCIRTIAAQGTYLRIHYARI